MEIELTYVELSKGCFGIIVFYELFVREVRRK